MTMATFIANMLFLIYFLIPSICTLQILSQVEFTYIGALCVPVQNCSNMVALLSPNVSVHTWNFNHVTTQAVISCPFGIASLVNWQHVFLLPGTE